MLPEEHPIYDHRDAREGRSKKSMCGDGPSFRDNNRLEIIFLISKNKEMPRNTSMIVWSLSVVVTYADGSWSSSFISSDLDGSRMIGPDVSRLQVIKELVASLGYTPKSGFSAVNPTSVVFRFSVIDANGRIGILADTEAIDIISNDLENVAANLGYDPFFIETMVEPTINYLLGDESGNILVDDLNTSIGV